MSEKCSLCGKPTDLPCGPVDHPVCPSCWLAIDRDDFLCMAPDIETAIDWERSRRDTPNEYEMMMLLP